MPEIWKPTQLDAIERKYPTPEVKALVAEIRRLNVIAWRAHDVMLQFDQIAFRVELRLSERWQRRRQTIEKYRW